MELHDPPFQNLGSRSPEQRIEAFAKLDHGLSPKKFSGCHKIRIWVVTIEFGHICLQMFGLFITVMYF